MALLIKYSFIKKNNTNNNDNKKYINKPKNILFSILLDKKNSNTGNVNLFSCKQKHIKNERIQLSNNKEGGERCMILLKLRKERAKSLREK